MFVPLGGRIEDLRGVIIQSGNDAASSRRGLAGSEQAFVDEMNKKRRRSA